MISGILGGGFKNACNSTEATTCPPLQHLDQMFVKNLQVNDFQIRKLPGSDHFSLIAELVI